MIEGYGCSINDECALDGGKYQFIYLHGEMQRLNDGSDLVCFETWLDKSLSKGIYPVLVHLCNGKDQEGNLYFWYDDYGTPKGLIVTDNPDDISFVKEKYDENASSLSGTVKVIRTVTFTKEGE